MNYFGEEEEPLSAEDLVLRDAGADPRVLRAVSRRALLQSSPRPGVGFYGGEVIPVSSPGARRYVRDYERNVGPIPRDERDRRHIVHHIDPLANGGSDTPDNMKLMPHDEHVRHHMENGDFANWGRRSWIAKTFGGTVEPAARGAASIARGAGSLARSVDGLNALSTLTGVLSGRVRLNSWGDMLGTMLGPTFQLQYDLMNQQPNPKTGELSPSKM